MQSLGCVVLRPQSRLQGRWSGSYRITFVVLATGTLMFGALQSLLLPAAPVLEHTLHTSTDAVSWLFTAYLLTAAIATPTLGRVGDILGKVRTLTLVLVAVAAGTLVAALADNVTVMIVGRALQGVAGGVLPLSFGIVRDEFPPERVAVGIGALAGSIGVGSGVAVVVSGLIVEDLDYHWLFWVTFVLAVLAAGATFLCLRDSPVRATGRISWRGAVTLSSWLICVLLAVTDGPTWGWLSPRVVLLLVVGLALIPVWIRAERRSQSPLIDMRLMAQPAVWKVNASALLFGFSSFSVFIFVPAFVETARSHGYGFGASVIGGGLYLLPQTGLMMLFAPLSGGLANRFGSRAVLVLGCVLGAIGYSLLAIWHRQPWEIYAASAIIGASIGMAFSSLTTATVEVVAPEQTGVATGMNSNMRNIGGAFGSAVGTSVLTASAAAGAIPSANGYALAFALAAAGMIGAAVLGGSLPATADTRFQWVSHPAFDAEAEAIVGVLPE